MLQATHGIVSGAPAYFKNAYGANVEEFFTLLWYPEKFLFNRRYYSEMAGSGELDEYLSLASCLTKAEKEELYNILSNKVRKDLRGVSALTKTKKVREIAGFYEPLTKDEEEKIWKVVKEVPKTIEPMFIPAADEMVEDSGLAA